MCPKCGAKMYQGNSIDEPKYQRCPICGMHVYAKPGKPLPEGKHRSGHHNKPRKRVMAFGMFQ